MERLKAWAKSFRRDVGALWLAARDPRVPFPAKLLAGLIAAYALSPIDLVPDFIPLIGYLDDLLIVPLGIWAVIRLIPPPILSELRERAAGMQRRSSRIGLAIVLSVWLLLGGSLLLLWVV